VPNGGAGNFLTEKIGPFPGYVWVLAVGGAGAALLYFTSRRNATAAAVTGSQSPPPGDSSQLTSAFPVAPVTYVTGIPDSHTGVNSSTPTGGPSVPAPNWQYGNPPSGGQYVWTLTNSGQNQYRQAYGQDWSGGAQPSTAPVPTQLGGYSWQWAPIPQGYDMQSYLAALKQAGLGGAAGMGGGVGTGMSPWQTFTQRWHAPTYVFGGMGGGEGGGQGGHAATVARKAGVHHNRLLSANPNVRRGRPSNLVRIA
jgi:hypothetical protein